MRPICLLLAVCLSSVGPAELQTVFDPKGPMGHFEILRPQQPRGAQLIRCE
eukprot:COSAG05_NODE_5847_length_1074_cov_0.609231_2_plen_50_part_01